MSEQPKPTPGREDVTEALIAQLREAITRAVVFLKDQRHFAAIAALEWATTGLGDGPPTAEDLESIARGDDARNARLSAIVLHHLRRHRASCPHSVVDGAPCSCP